MFAFFFSFGHTLNALLTLFWSPTPKNIIWLFTSKTIVPFMNEGLGLTFIIFFGPSADKWCLSQTNVWILESPRSFPLQYFVSMQSVNGINLLSLLREACYLQDIISKEIFFFLAACSSPPRPSLGCLSDREAAHQNAIRTLLATRRTHAHNASCGGHSLPFTSASRLPLQFTISLHPCNAPSQSQPNKAFYDIFLVCADKPT